MFKKPLVIIIAVIVIILVIVFIYRASGGNNKVQQTASTTSTSNTKTAETKSGPDYKNISYNIDGDEIKLISGKAETPTSPGSASVISTEYFGNEARGDLNGDGTEDVALLLAQDGGGTGVFYYAVVALSLGGDYKGTNAVFIGDRISPQTTEIKNGQIIVNYADRGPDEPMSSEPTIAHSKYLKIVNGELVEVK